VQAITRIKTGEPGKFDVSLKRLPPHAHRLQHRDPMTDMERLTQRNASVPFLPSVTCSAFAVGAMAQGHGFQQRPGSFPWQRCLARSVDLRAHGAVESGQSGFVQDTCRLLAGIVAESVRIVRHPLK
jgi:hypothetical protein